MDSKHLIGEIMEDSNVVTYQSTFSVDLVQHCGDDEMICRAARVSTLGMESLDTDESAGLINFLAENRHGSPFEHDLMTFRIAAPIFVWREFMRHRIGFSYNEQSGRYMEMIPVFYVPAEDRNLVQVGKAGKYDFVPGNELQHHIMKSSMQHANQTAWNQYQIMLESGIAKEVARMCLPVNIYSAAYVSCNARSMMNFLSLRTKTEGSLFKSFPMKEINMVADQMEYIFSNLFPLTWNAFNAARRVAP
jgi:flavin-dependent thymidylate synthase